jgi:hypothetical protein
MVDRHSLSGIGVEGEHNGGRGGGKGPRRTRSRKLIFAVVLWPGPSLFVDGRDGNGGIIESNESVRGKLLGVDDLRRN